MRVVQGEVFDVALDIRKDSPTYGRWVGVNLECRKQKTTLIPPGLAHGLTLSENCGVSCQTTDYYAPEVERCIRWNDSTLNIDWPIESSLLLSAKDSMADDFCW